MKVILEVLWKVIRKVISFGLWADREWKPSFSHLWVGGWWCTEILVSALLLFFLNWDFESRIKKFEQRGAGAELDNKLFWTKYHTYFITIIYIIFRKPWWGCWWLLRQDPDVQQGDWKIWTNWQIGTKKRISFHECCKYQWLQLYVEIIIE